MHIEATAVVVAVMLNLSFLVCCHASSGEIDATAIAVNVHDGDTFNIDKITNGSGTVRLADVDASELGQPLSYEARDFLKGLVLAKTVYLDVDDIYVDYNSTHYENVNEALWIVGLVEKKEYDNEFSVDTWTLYVPKTDLDQTQPLEFPWLLVIALFVVIIVIAILPAVILRRRNKK